MKAFTVKQPQLLPYSSSYAPRRAAPFIPREQADVTEDMLPHSAVEGAAAETAVAAEQPQQQQQQRRLVFARWFVG